VKDEGVFVLDFALDDPVPKRGVVLSGRDSGTICGVRAEDGGRHGQRTEDFAVGPLDERFVYHYLDGFAEEDEAGVRVFRASAGSSFEWEFETGAE
jgi:hypothetical protein